MILLAIINIITVDNNILGIQYAPLYIHENATKLSFIPQNALSPFPNQYTIPAITCEKYFNVPPHTHPKIINNNFMLVFSEFLYKLAKKPAKPTKV